MDYRTLPHTGHKVSTLSFGASSLGGVFYETDDSRSKQAVFTAIDEGFNYIDVSPYYGITRAETVLGTALKDLKRDDYLLSTKCGRYEADEFDFSAERVTKSIDESLGRLQVDHVDFLFCHDIEFVELEQIWEETLPALQKIKDAGKTRIVNASPTSMGILTDRGAPDWHPAPKDIQEACAKAVAHCQSKGADISKLAMQFSCANEQIPTTLFSSANPDRIKQNASFLDDEMDLELLAEVQDILSPIKDKTWQSGLAQNND